MRLALALILAPGIVAAETPLSGDAFDAMTQGHVLQWVQSDTVFATERYLPGRKLLWSYPDDLCRIGTWYPEADAICFHYEDDLEPVCWKMTATDNGFLAYYTANPPGSPPVTVKVADDEPLPCEGM